MRNDLPIIGLVYLVMRSIIIFCSNWMRTTQLDSHWPGLAKSHRAIYCEYVLIRAVGESARPAELGTDQLQQLGARIHRYTDRN